MAQSTADRAFAALVKNYFLDAADARQPREAIWRDAYKRTDPSYIDKTKVKGPFKVKVAYTYRTVETHTAQLMEASMANGRWINLKAANPDIEEEAVKAVSQALENQFRRRGPDYMTDNEESLEREARLGLVYGNSACLVEWHRGGIRFRALDPFDLFLDWRAGRFYIIRRVVTLAELKDMAESISAPQYEIVTDETGQEVRVPLGPRDGGRALKAFKKVERAIRSGEKTGYLFDTAYAEHGTQRRSDFGRVEGSDRETEDDRVAAKDDPFNARIALLEYHETHEDGAIAWVIPNFANDNEDLVFRSEPNPYGCCQLASWVPRIVDNEFYGLGTSEVIGHNAEGMDVTYRAFLEQVVRTARPAVLYNKNLRLRQEYLRSQSGISIPVLDTANDIRYMDVPATAASLWQAAFGFVRSVADLGTGESEQRRGQIGGARSATEAAIAEQAGTITDRALFRRWRRHVEHIAHIALRVMRVHMTRDEMIPILGRQAAAFLKLRPEYLDAEYIVTFGGNVGGASPVQRQAGYRAIATTYGAAGVVDVAALARADISELGHTNPDLFMATKSTAISVSPDFEHQQLMAGQMLRVSESDNHMEHLIRHGEKEQELLRTGDPRAADLRDHMMVHYQTLIMQQQAAQMQAAPSAPSPFRPEQAGGPGQPAAFTARTAQVNADRQASNGATPGQSPGPSGGRQVGTVVTGGNA